jgi:tRNA G18 (ribose-2'-O)-methylase SpoU
MYNYGMPTSAYQIRLCNSCGLRYPLTEGHDFGTRCPVCMGGTRLILSRDLIYEPLHARHLTPNPSPFRKGERGELAALLDNIRSAWNVGSIFRSADGFGFAHAYVCGITPTPDIEAVAKTALGAEDSVSWSYHKDAVKLVKGLKKEGWKIWALEENETAVSISHAETIKANERTVLIAGSEVTGVDPELLDAADKVFYIPMRGEKKSFNVAMAFSIAAYALNQSAD